MAVATARAEDFPCAHCGAPMSFAPASSQLVCDHCGAAVPLALAGGVVATYDLFGPTAQAALAAAQVVHAGREIECKRCGARAMTTREADRCAFCDAPMVVEVEAKAPGIPPGGVLPFVIDRARANQALAAWMKKRWFAPRDLVARARRGQLDGVYLPAWIFDAASTTTYMAERGIHHGSVAGAIFDAATSSKPREQPHTEWQLATGTVQVATMGVVIIATPSVPEPLLDRLAAWQLDRVRRFDSRYLAGFIAERYRIDVSDGFRNAYAVLESRILDEIYKQIGGDEQTVKKLDVRWDSVCFRHVLVPVWLSAFHYNGDVFHIAVDAETGSVVGERPWSFVRIALFVLGLLAAVIAIAAIAGQ